MGIMFKPALNKKSILTVLFGLIGWGGLLAIAVPPASAQFKSWVMAKLPDLPWGLGTDSEGNVYTSLILTNEVVMLKDDGSYDHVAWVPSKEESGKGGYVGGLDFDKADNIYVIYKAASKYDPDELTNPLHPACRDTTVTRSGVYKIDAKTRQVTALATRADGWPFCWPHDLRVDSQGNVYMADITYPAIWKISPDGKKVDLWLTHSLLGWPANPDSGFFIGVSTLALDKQEKNLYAATMGDPKVLKIPIKEDGSAGEPQALQPSGYSMLDGVELDANGNIYISEMMRNEIWVLSPDGSQRMLIADRNSAPLDNNVSLRLRGDVLCTANFGYIHQNPAKSDRTVVCMKGFPVPK
jgi:sugar lactone lactonase YvrE